MGNLKTTVSRLAGLLKLGLMMGFVLFSVFFGNASANDVDFDAIAADINEAVTNYGMDAAKEIQGHTRGADRDTFSYVASAIADEKIARAVDEVYKIYGLESSDQLYIFVSFSMPEDMIRAYAIEAAYIGGILVFRGIPEDEDLSSFVHGRLASFINTVGNTAPIQIDPRLFQAFDVKHVPTIVYTKERLDDLCLVPNKCGSLDKNLYHSIEGAVTTQYALEWMQIAGADGVQRYLTNLAKGYADNPTMLNHDDLKKQGGVNRDDFNKRLRELAVMNAKKINASKQNNQNNKVQIYESPWGPVVGPATLDAGGN